MQKFLYAILFIGLAFLVSCGTPNDPESISGGDGGYKIVSKFLTTGFAQDVVINDTLAYVAQSEGGMMILSISDRRVPKALSTVSQGLKGSAYKLARKDSVIFLAAGGFGASTINVSNPLDPKIGYINLSLKPARSFEIMDNWLFTAVGEFGFQVSEISYPLEPDIRAQTSTPGFAQAVCVTPDKEYMLVACGEMGFAIFYIYYMYNGQNPYPMTGWVDTPGYSEDVAAHPDLPYAFLACGTGGFFIVDYSDSANVKVIGGYSTGGYAKEVLYKDNKAYVTTGLRGLQIFDVSNITSPVRIGTVQTKLAKGLAIDDKYVYVADEQEGLVIISIP